MPQRKEDQERKVQYLILVLSLVRLSIELLRFAIGCD